MSGLPRRAELNNLCGRGTLVLVRLFSPAGLFPGDGTLVVLFLGGAYYTPPFLFHVHYIALTNSEAIVGNFLPHSAFVFICQSRRNFTFDDLYVFLSSA